jgi:holo-[acyl-carrier protein] synthase
MVLGVGVDLVNITRFEEHVAKQPKLLERLFVSSELDASMKTIAGRFAAKEALIKALGGSDGVSWHEVQVSKNESGKPEISTSGQTAETLRKAGISKLHLSISHDAGMAVALVVAE